MNKKFKYKKSLLAAILSATLLAGCDGGGSGSSSDTPPVDSGTGSLPEVKPDPTPNPEPTPEPTPDPEPTPEPIPDPEPTPEPEPEPVPTKTGYLTLGGSLRVTGDITCNDESSDGFTFTPGDKVTCVAGNNTTIATFDMGDVLLFAALGSWVGPLSLPNVALIASCCGLIYAVITKRGSTTLPFGPCLSLGGIATIYLQALF